jgi:hypothetical protein
VLYSNPKVKELNEQHKRAFGTDINNFGYPDMGNGRYFQLCSYEMWVKFNNMQRAHYNMIEQSAPVLACVIFGGMGCPRFAAACGFANALGRVIYALGYTTNKGSFSQCLCV